MKQQLVSCLISLAFLSGNLFAMDRGNIVQSELKDLVVSKITVVADRKKVIATLTQGCSGAHVIPGGHAPVVVRGGGDGPKPLDARTFQFELDPVDEVDALTFHLLLKAQGTFSTINLALGANGQISSVELGGSCPSVVYEQGGPIAKH